MSRARTLDDLARRLAEPMPRRRALRVLGTSIAAVAFPTVAPRLASAATAHAAATCLEGPGISAHTCNPNGSHECRCFPKGIEVMKATCQPGSKCCCTKSANGSGNVLCINRPCQPGETWCGGNRNCTAARCCKPGEECGWDGSRYKCTCATQRCGSRCCRADETCCGTRCCEPPATCKTDGKKYYCLCPDDRPQCGSKCCKPGETCKNGKCCKPGALLCDGECCAEGEVCQKCLDSQQGGAIWYDPKRRKCCPPDSECCGGSGCYKKSLGRICCDGKLCRKGQSCVNLDPAVTGRVGLACG